VITLKELGVIKMWCIQRKKEIISSLDDAQSANTNAKTPSGFGRPFSAAQDPELPSEGDDLDKRIREMGDIYMPSERYDLSRLKDIQKGLATVVTDLSISDLQVAASSLRQPEKVRQTSNASLALKRQWCRKSVFHL